MAGRRVKLQTPLGEQSWLVKLLHLARNQYTKVHGWCRWNNHTIEVDPRLDNEDYFRALIHEGSHVALGPDFDEPPIERIEHNVFVLICHALRERFDIDLTEE
jgi:hypothetical protein